MSSERNSPDTAPTVLEYARFHGVAVNHLEFDHVDDLTLECQRAVVDLEDPPGASTLTFAAVPSDDNIQCIREVALIIVEAMRRPKTPPWEDLVPKHPEPFDPKLELPLLMTDHDEDMRKFGVKEDPDDTICNLLMADTDERRDEGLSWPSWYEKYPKKCMDVIRQEKLDIPKDAWVYLQQVIRMNPADEDVDTLFGPCPQFEKKRNLEPLTPLLSPIDPPLVPYVPSSSTLELPLLSEHTSPLTEEHRKAEEAVANEKLELQEFRSTGGSSGLLFEGSPLEELVDLPMTPPRRFKTSDLKVSPLLSLPRHVERTAEDPKTLLEESKDSLKLDAAPLADADEEEQVSNLLELSKKASEWVQENLKQERPTGEAVKLRVDVPPMDFSIPVPPWEMEPELADKKIKSPAAIFMPEISKQNLAQYIWRSDPTQERKLPWRVFPHEKGAVEVRDVFEESAYLTTLLEEIRLSEEIDYNTLLPGLQPFQRYEFEEDRGDELLPLDIRDSTHHSGTIPVPEHLHEALQPRARLLDTHAHPTATNRTVVSLKRQLPQPARSESLLIGSGHSGPTRKEPDANIDLLSAFLKSRGRSPKKLKMTDPESSFFSNKPLVEAASNSAPAIPTPDATLSPSKEIPNEPVTPSQSTLSLPAHPITFIVPLALQKTHRPLLNAIQTLFPATEFIERDYSRPPLQPPSLTTLPSIPETEADIALSPSTALILTTIPLITQTSLPGRGPPVSPLRTRIAAIASRYERLYVLVSSTSQILSLSTSTSAALSSLTAFCASIYETSAVTPLLIPSSTTKDYDTIGRYILHLASKYCIDLPSTGLGITMLPEETTWEVFLRAAGLNTYAAQVLVNLVKAPNNEVDGIMEGVEVSEIAYNSNGERKSKYWSSSSSIPSRVIASQEKKMYGLQVILHMSPLEREQMFGEVMGGVRVLRRVGVRLDGMWG